MQRHGIIRWGSHIIIAIGQLLWLGRYDAVSKAAGRNLQQDAGRPEDVGCVRESVCHRRYNRVTQEVGTIKGGGVLVNGKEIGGDKMDSTGRSIVPTIS